MSFKVYPFGAITGVNPSTYSNMNINGEIVKIIYKRGDAAAAGSLWVYESGATPEQILFIKNVLQTDAVFYPFVAPVDNLAVTGSPQAFFRRAVNAPIQVVGSGFGNASSGISGLFIYFR
jgi:hypothetical protein